MRRSPVGVGRSLFLTLVMICLTLSTSLINPVSGNVYSGKTSDFEYYSTRGDWHTYVRFSVEEWDSNEGIAIIRVTNESAIQDFRLLIPEWSIVDSEGNITGRWPYCPIWLDLSGLVKGLVFDNPNAWLCNFTVDTITSDTCSFERILPYKDDYQIIEHLYYDVDHERIQQYDYSRKHISNVVFTVRLLYYPGRWTFTHEQALFESGLKAILIVGVFIELAVIIILIARRLRK